MLTAPNLSGPNLPPLTESSLGMPVSMPGTYEEGMSRNEQPTTSPGPESLWTTILLSTRVSQSTNQEQQQSKKDWLLTSSETYEALALDADFTDYAPTPWMNNLHWNSPSPILWTGSNQYNAMAGSESCWGFQFNEETFGKAIWASGDNPKAYWRQPVLLPNSPPARVRGYREQGIQQHGYNPWHRRSVMLGGAGPDTQMEGAGGLGEALAPTIEERLAQAQAQLTQMHTRENQLCADLEAAKKGKEPNRRQQP